jgi:hypothetical protein
MLGAIGSIVALVCGIFVLVKLFEREGVWKGILGLICLLYTYIWGWMHINDESLKIRNWMYVWTAAIVLGIVLNVIAQTQRGG